MAGGHARVSFVCQTTHLRRKHLTHSGKPGGAWLDGTLPPSQNFCSFLLRAPRLVVDRVQGYTVGTSDPVHELFLYNVIACPVWYALDVPTAQQHVLPFAAFPRCLLRDKTRRVSNSRKYRLKQNVSKNMPADTTCCSLLSTTLRHPSALSPAHGCVPCHYLVCNLPPPRPSPS